MECSADAPLVSSRTPYLEFLSLNCSVDLKGVHAFVTLAEKYKADGDKPKALKALDRALKLARSKLGEDDRITSEIAMRRLELSDPAAAAEQRAQIAQDTAHKSEPRRDYSQLATAAIFTTEAQLAELDAQSEARYADQKTYFKRELARRRADKGRTPAPAPAPAPAPETAAETCDACGVGVGALAGQKLLRCAGCKTARYCGRSCQKAAWQGHKVQCKQQRKQQRKPASCAAASAPPAATSAPTAALAHEQACAALHAGDVAGFARTLTDPALDLGFRNPRTGWALLHELGSETGDAPRKAVEQLFEAVALRQPDLDVRTAAGIAGSTNSTPLHIAAQFGAVHLVRLLAGAGAALELRSAFDKTPLLVAASFGRQDVMRALQSAGADVRAELQGGQNYLGECVEGRINAADCVCYYAAPHGNNPYDSEAERRERHKRLRPALEWLKGEGVHPSPRACDFMYHTTGSYFGFTPEGEQRQRD